MVTITWRSTEVFSWDFDDTELAPYLDDAGEVDTDAMDTLLADLQGEPGAYEHTPDRTVIGVRRDPGGGRS